MQKVRVYPDGSQVVHVFDEMTPDKRPQDVDGNGSSLIYTTLEHHGDDMFPQALEVADLDGRSCIYVPEEDAKAFPDKRPRDYLAGDGLRFEPFAHGGEYPDMMPQAVRVTDADGRSCVYIPVVEDGQVVDSKYFKREYPDTQKHAGDRPAQARLSMSRSTTRRST